MTHALCSLVLVPVNYPRMQSSSRALTSCYYFAACIDAPAAVHVSTFIAHDVIDKCTDNHMYIRKLNQLLDPKAKIAWSSHVPYQSMSLDLEQICLATAVLIAKQTCHEPSEHQTTCQAHYHPLPTDSICAKPKKHQVQTSADLENASIPSMPASAQSSIAESYTAFTSYLLQAAFPCTCPSPSPRS